MKPVKDRLRAVFFGTPAVAVECLRQFFPLVEIAAVVTQPDKPAGRSKSLTAPPVKKLALEMKEAGYLPEEVPIYQFPKIGAPEAVEELLALEGVDLALVCAYGQIIPREIFDWPRLRTVNIHFSLLPHWRGASPVEAALMAGESETGVTLQFINEQLDEGEILLQNRVPIYPDWTSVELFDRLIQEMEAALHEMVSKLIRVTSVEQLDTRPQDQHQATYCQKITGSAGKIDWSRDAATIFNLWRALYIRPGVYTNLSGKRVKIREIVPMASMKGLAFLMNRGTENFKWLPGTPGDIKTGVNVFGNTTESPEKRLAGRDTSKPATELFEPGQVLGTLAESLVVFSAGPFRAESEALPDNNPARNLLFIHRLQPEGKKEMSGQDFVNGRQLSWGAVME